HRAGLVIVFAARGVDGAAAGQPGALRPGDPVLEERAQTLHAARCLERREEHRLGELPRAFVEGGDLQVGPGPEVREKPALGQAGLLRERADRERLEAARARLLHGGSEDLGAGLLALGWLRGGGHAGIIVRPYLLVKWSLAGVR